jgi:signal transduction histidine kinase
MSPGFHGYSPDELLATTVITRGQDPRWRWVLPVTRSTRDFIIEQMPALVASYGIAIGIILAAAIFEQSQTPAVIALWLLEGGLSIAARIAIFRRLVRASPVEVVSRPSLRLAPLAAILLAAIHWSWTATLFIGPHLTMSTVVVLLTFVMLSIACLGIAPASPVISAAYLTPMWLATAWMLLHSDWASAGILVVLAAALAGVLWSAFYIVVSGVRRYLIRSDEVDLLMRQLRDRNAEVEALRKTAAEDLETRTAVFASASHDLRQRIHALKLLAHSRSVSAADASADPSAIKRLIGVIEDLEVFVTDVLHFVRLDSYAKAPERRVLALQDMMQDVELAFEEVALVKRIRLRTRPTTIGVVTDRVMLLRVVENLVSNAIKFTRGGVLVTSRRRGPDVHIEIWDQGPGLDPTLLEVESAQRPASQTREPDEGFGLGLFIVRRLSNALGYRVQVHSSKGRGTRVSIVVPAADVLEETHR